MFVANELTFVHFTSAATIPKLSLDPFFKKTQHITCTYFYAKLAVMYATGVY